MLLHSTKVSCLCYRTSMLEVNGLHYSGIFSLYLMSASIKGFLYIEIHIDVIRNIWHCFLSFSDPFSTFSVLHSSIDYDLYIFVFLDFSFNFILTWNNCCLLKNYIFIFIKISKSFFWKYFIVSAMYNYKWNNLLTFFYFLCFSIYSWFWT